MSASQVWSDRGGGDRHHAAACKRLEWAEEAAARREYEDAREWRVVTVDAAGDQSPERYRTKRLASSPAGGELRHRGACDAR